MFMGSLRSSPAGSRAGDDDDDDDEEALMLGERVGGVQGGRLCSDGTWRPSLPPSPDKGSLDGDSEGLRDSPVVEVVEATAASRLARRGVRRTLLLSEDMALRLALRPLSPLPCLEEKQSEFLTCRNFSMLVDICSRYYTVYHVYESASKAKSDHITRAPTKTILGGELTSCLTEETT